MNVIFFLISDLQNKILKYWQNIPSFHALHIILMSRKLPASHRFLKMQDASALIATPKLSHEVFFL